MRKFVMILGMLSVFGTGYDAFAQNRDWRSFVEQIKLLDDGYDGVMKLSGGEWVEPAQRHYGHSIQLDDSKISVVYASGQCVDSKGSPGTKIGWQVPEWTVTTLAVSLKQPIQLQELGFDLSSFKRTRVFDDGPNIYEFTNDAAGITFWERNDGRVKSIDFYPGTKYDSIQCA